MKEFPFDPKDFGEIRRMMRAFQDAAAHSSLRDAASIARGDRDLMSRAYIGVGLEAVRKMQLVLARSITMPYARVHEMIKPFEQLQINLAKQVESISKIAHEAWKRSMPKNWEELSFEECRSAVDLMIATGWALAWIPRSTVIRALLAAPEENRAQVLLDQRTRSSKT